MDESRKQFEAWYAASMKERVSWYTSKNVASDLTLDEDGSYMRTVVRQKFEAWQASREAIEIELPEPHAHLIWIQAGYAPDDYWDDVEVSRSEQDKCCDGSERYAVYAEHEVVELIESSGLKVKK